MPKISELQRDRATVHIQIPVDRDENGAAVTMPLVVVYRPSAMTGNTELDLSSKIFTRGEKGWRADYGLSYIHALVIEWDLETDDGEPYPLWIHHPDNLAADGEVKSHKSGFDPLLPCLAALPQPLVSLLIEGISEDMGKDQASSNDS